MPLLFVTAVAVPFSSVADQVLLLPTALVAVASASRARYVATSFVAINAVALTLIVAQENPGPSLAVGTSMALLLGICAAAEAAPRRDCELPCKHG